MTIVIPKESIHRKYIESSLKHWNQKMGRALDTGYRILDDEEDISSLIDLIDIQGREIEHLKEGLRKIEEFGKKNPGYGWSCSGLAKKYLDEEGT